jgi:hypothetical protein
MINNTAAAWGKAVKRDAGNGQSHAQEIAVRDEMRDEISRRVSRLSSLALVLSNLVRQQQDTSGTSASNSTLVKVSSLVSPALPPPN